MMKSILIIYFVAFISLAVFEDLRRQKIPNIITFPAMFLALSYHSIVSGLNGLLFSAGGLGVAMGLFLIPYMMGGMGAGDVKLMGATGAVFGPMGVLIASILVIMAGGVYGIVLMVLNSAYLTSFIKRSWSTVKTFFLTRQLILIPPDPALPMPVLKFAIPIAIGALGYMAMLITGYDLFPELLGDNFSMFSIALAKGGN